MITHSKADGVTVTFDPTGDSNGLKIVKKSRWAGRGFVIPRAKLGECKERIELRRIGVYILYALGTSTARPAVYIGQSKDVLGRLEEQKRAKPFWSHVVVFTSTDRSLDEAYVQLLESRLIQSADIVRRFELKNRQAPKASILETDDNAGASKFLDNMLLCLSHLDLDMFSLYQWNDYQSQVHCLKHKTIEAYARVIPQGFLVQQGSGCVGDSACAKDVSRKTDDFRQRLVKQHVLIKRDKDFRLAMDYRFDSPEHATRVLLGNSMQAVTAWKPNVGKTLKDLKAVGGNDG